jgi:hypothetical protein
MIPDDVVERVREEADIVSVIGECRSCKDPSTLDPKTDGLAVCGPRETGVVLPGETADPAKMLAWGRIRAGVSTADNVQYLRFDAIRYMDTPSQKER